MTQSMFYQHYQEETPDALLLMRDYDAYEILGEKGDEVYPLLKPVLTHKDAGECFEYYAGYSFSFGKHNLDKVLPVLIRANYRICIIDYNEHRKSKEYKDEQEHFFKKLREDRERERQKHKVYVEQAIPFEW